MGIPVRSNIFRIGSSEQQYFSRFPIQVATLFSPTDSSFSTAFRDLFLHLDKITGKEVAFFAVLDPPIDWQYFAQTRSWWQEYQAEVGKLGFSFDDRTLVYEIARRFSVAWNELPALVIGTSLWAAEFATTPTSEHLIEEQLTVLTKLVREWKKPTMGQIIQLLEDELGAEVRFQPGYDVSPDHFSQFYGVLGTYDLSEKKLDKRAFNRYFRSELRFFGTQNNALNQARAPRGSQEDDYGDVNKVFDHLASEIMGRLFPFSTAAMREFQNLANQRDIPVIESLDEESLLMLETSLSVGNLLEIMVDNSIPGLTLPRLKSTRQKKHQQMRQRNVQLDFTPGAQGVWKSLEREINLSMIQAARKARGIEMPEYFALYCHGFDEKKCRVDTGRGSPRHLNVRDNRDKIHHKFFTLGASWYVTRAMLNEDEMVKVLLEYLDDALPDNLLPDWNKVNQLRNKASHVSSLSRREYEETLNLVLNPEFLIVAMEISIRLTYSRQTIYIAI